MGRTIPYFDEEDPTANYDDPQICSDCPGTGSLMCCFYEHAVAEDEQRKQDAKIVDAMGTAGHVRQAKRQIEKFLEDGERNRLIAALACLDMTQERG